MRSIIAFLAAFALTPCHAADCYVFLGGSDDCSLLFIFAPEGECSDGDGECIEIGGEWQCENAQSVQHADPPPQWDKTLASEDEGYESNGGGEVVCYYYADCGCDDVNMTGNSDTCVTLLSTADVEEESVPEIDINMPCPGLP